MDNTYVPRAPPSEGGTPSQPPPYIVESVLPPGLPAPVIVQSATALGSETQSMTCPHCHAHISTSVKVKANSRTHLIALLLCFLCCCVCGCCYPYCIDSCQSMKHYCPACQAYLGQYNG